MGQTVSYPRPIDIVISPTYVGKRPTTANLERLIKSKRWKTVLKYALPNSFTKKTMKVKSNKIYITGIAENDSFSKAYIKDGFHKATYAGDPIKIAGSELYINYKKVNIKIK